MYSLQAVTVLMSELCCMMSWVEELATHQDIGDLQREALADLAKARKALEQVIKTAEAKCSLSEA